MSSDVQKCTENYGSLSGGTLQKVTMGLDELAGLGQNTLGTAYRPVASTRLKL